MVAINEELRALIARRNLSQRQLEATSGVSQSVISKAIFKDESVLNLSQFEEICRALGVSPSSVLEAAERATLAQQEQAEVSRVPAQNLYALAANHERRPEEDAQEADYF